MRVATLSRTTSPKPWIVLALATLSLVLAGASTLDTDRSELSDVNSKHYVSISDQTANIDENSAVGTVVLNTAVSGTPTGCTIGNGNTDQDGDGSRPFAIATNCQITVNDAGDLDYENYAQTFTLRIHVNDATSADIAFITVSVDDTNDQTPVYNANDADDDITVAENSGTGSFDAGTITDTDTGNSFTCTLGGDDAALFDCDITDNTVDLSFKSSPDYDNAADTGGNNVYEFTVLINDGAANDGNGPTSVTVRVTDLNDQAPSWTTANTASVNENSQAVATLAATDTDTADSGGLAYAIQTNDNDLFEIDGTTLQFATAPNYEAPGCGSSSNSCTVTVRATDAAGATTDLTITVTINDLNDQTPSWTTSNTASVNENSQTVATLAATDTDTADSGGLAYAIQTNDNDLFEIDGTTLQFATAPNYEAPGCGSPASNSCSVTVRATDAAGATADLTITVTINDLNDQAPSWTTSNTASVNENSQTVVAALAATDTDTADAGGLAYAIQTNDNDLFEIDGTTLQFATAPNYEAPGCGSSSNSCTVTVRATDAAGATADLTITVTVQDVNDQTPVYNANDADDDITVAENSGTGSFDAGTITDTDTGNSFTCTLGGDDAALFDCDITDNTVDLSFKSSPDYDNAADTGGNNVYEFTVLINDGAANDGNGPTSVTVRVTDLNDQTPVYNANDADDDITVAENSGTGSFDAGTITDTDTGNSFTCTLGGDDAALFDCDITDNTVDLSFKSSPDYDNAADTGGNNVYEFTVLINDGAANDGNGPTSVTVRVTDLNDQAPSWTTANTASVNENSQTVATLAATDTDTADSGGLAYAIQTNDNDLFEIDGTTLQFATAPNYEAPGCGSSSNSCTVTVRATDAAGTTTDLTITVTINDLNDQTPSWTTSNTASVNENSQTVATLAATDTDTADSGGLAYAIQTNDNDLFEIDGTTLQFATAPNYEAPGCGSPASNSCSVTVRATDAAGATADLTITVTINDLNDQTPVYNANDADDDITVAENSGTGSFDAGTITDTDTGNSFTCTLGGDDAALFDCDITDNTVDLSFKSSPDYDNAADTGGNNVYEFTVLINDGAANDGNGPTSVTVGVTDLNDQAPRLDHVQHGLGQRELPDRRHARGHRHGHRRLRRPRLRDPDERQRPVRDRRHDAPVRHRARLRHSRLRQPGLQQLHGHRQGHGRRRHHHRPDHHGHDQRPQRPDPQLDHVQHGLGQRELPDRRRRPRGHRHGHRRRRRPRLRDPDERQRPVRDRRHDAPVRHRAQLRGARLRQLVQQLHGHRQGHGRRRRHRRPDHHGHDQRPQRPGAQLDHVQHGLGQRELPDRRHARGHRHGHRRLRRPRLRDPDERQRPVRDRRHDAPVRHRAQLRGARLRQPGLQQLHGHRQGHGRRRRHHRPDHHGHDQRPQRPDARLQRQRRRRRHHRRRELRHRLLRRGHHHRHGHRELIHLHARRRRRRPLRLRHHGQHRRPLVQVIARLRQRRRHRREQRLRVHRPDQRRRRQRRQRADLRHRQGDRPQRPGAQLDHGQHGLGQREHPDRRHARGHRHGHRRLRRPCLLNHLQRQQPILNCRGHYAPVHIST